MFDTMTLTKAGGALCGTLLVYLLGGWAAELIYHGSGGHDDHHAQAYVIEVEDAGGETEVAEVIEFGPLMASASAADGEGLWRGCRSCHALEAGENGTGPYLYGVVNREVGTASGFEAYSGALSEVADVWTPENLYNFLENPKAYAPGTSMGYNGMRDPQDRVNLIAYLESISE